MVRTYIHTSVCISTSYLYVLVDIPLAHAATLRQGCAAASRCARRQRFPDLEFSDNGLMNGNKEKDRCELMTDWLSAAAGDEVLAEELKTGICRCGTALSKKNDGCRWHVLGVDGGMYGRSMGVWTKRALTSDGPRGEDMELLCRFLPRELLFAFEVLVHRSVVVPGGGRGYDENVDPRAGRRSGGLGATKSGTVERGIGAGGGSGGSGGGGAGKNGSRGNVVRDEQALGFRKQMERRLRKAGLDILNWLEAVDEGGSGKAVKKTVWRCTGRRCGLFAERGWTFCPRCGCQVEERTVA